MSLKAIHTRKTLAMRDVCRLLSDASTACQENNMISAAVVMVTDSGSVYSAHCYGEMGYFQLLGAIEDTKHTIVRGSDED